MNRIKGKLILVTGASSGIGEATARAFASYGADLILCARRQDRIQALGRELEEKHRIQVRTRVMDVRDQPQVEAFVQELKADDAVPDVVVNNAGKALGMDLFHQADLADWEEMIDTNVKGLLYVSRALLPLMVERDSGHVVNIGSIAGRQVYQKGAVYNASKFAVRAINEGMALDLVGTNIRVSSVDPGLVMTEFSEVRFHGNKDKAQSVYQGYKPLIGEDIAEIICFVVNRPDHVNILDLTVFPTAQRSAHTVHRDPA